MLYLKEMICGVGGSKSERYVTDPIQVDRVAREAWNPICAGNVADALDHCKRFVAKYAAFLHHPTEKRKCKTSIPKSFTNSSYTASITQEAWMGGPPKTSQL